MVQVVMNPPASTTQPQSTFSRLAGLIFSKKQKPEAVKSKLKCCKNPCPDLFHLMVKLPYELQLEIISYLDFSDICTIRILARKVYWMVHGCSDALVSRYARRNMTLLEKQLYPVPPSRDDAMQYLFDAYRRANTVNGLTNILCDEYLRDVYKFNRKDARLVPQLMKIWNILYIIMRPSILIIYDFLEKLRARILTRSIQAWNMQEPDRHSRFRLYNKFTDLWDDQLTIIERYDPARLRDCFNVYSYLVHIVDSRMKYGMTKMLWDSGLHIIHIPNADFLFVMGGLDKVFDCTRKSSPRLRKHEFYHTIRSLNPSISLYWRRYWQELNIKEIAGHLDKLETMVIITPPLRSIWLRAAYKVIQDSTYRTTISATNLTSDDDDASTGNNFSLRSPYYINMLSPGLTAAYSGLPSSQYLHGLLRNALQRYVAKARK